ncbi:MAG: RDD family protein [Acidimicrobiales bacterium]
MTGPTPDSSGNIAPGLYHAEGDPPGTVRQWDGTQWVGGPVPAPPGSAAAPPPPGAVQGAAGNFADTGVRIGAILLDGLVFFVLAIATTVPFLEDTDPDSGSFEFQATGVSTLIGPLAMLALTIFLVATRGGSPGKLMLGLRVTMADGTTPIGYGPATIRVLPWLPTMIPFLGVIAWLGVVIGSLIMMSSDTERRSLFDRIANTRVVRK